MTKINGLEWSGKVDVLVGGTPCQAFSVAGLRRGLDDERGNLSVVFAGLAMDINPDFIVWENVPGVLSDKTNAFGCLLGALAGEDDPLQPPGGRWTNAGFVLGPERAIAWRVLDAQYFGVAQRRRRVFLVACPRDGADPRAILFEREGVRRDFAPSREAGEVVAGGVVGSLGAGDGNRGWQNDLDQGAFIPCRAVAFTTRGRADGLSVEFQEDLAYALKNPGNGGRSNDRMIAHAMQVRRLTPTECERLQGVPDGHTQIPWRGKPAEECPDGNRYKSIGNSMAVPCMRWIGMRIELIGGRRGATD